MAPIIGMSTDNHMVVERDQLLSLGYLDEFTSVLLACRRASMDRIYNMTLRAFCRWCRRKKVSVLDPP